MRMNDIFIYLSVAYVCLLVPIENARAYSKKLGATVVYSIEIPVYGTGSSDGLAKIIYEDGHTVTMTRDEGFKFQNDRDVAIVRFWKKPSKEAYEKLDDFYKAQVSAWYLDIEPPAKSGLTKESLREFGKPFFEALEDEDKSEVAKIAIDGLAYRCPKKTLQDNTEECESKTAAHISELLQKMRKWKNDDIKKTVCMITGYLGYWNPASEGNDVRSWDSDYIQRTKIMLRLMDTSEDFGQLKNTECNYGGNSYQISDRLLNAKHSLPALQARVAKSKTVQGTYQDQGCSPDRALTHIFSATKEIYLAPVDAQSVAVINESGCSLSYDLKKTGKKDYLYMYRNIRFMQTGEPIKFQSNSDLVVKLYGAEAVNDPTIKKLLGSATPTEHLKPAAQK